MKNLPHDGRAYFLVEKGPLLDDLTAAYKTLVINRRKRLRVLKEHARRFGLDGVLNWTTSSGGTVYSMTCFQKVSKFNGYVEENARRARAETAVKAAIVALNIKHAWSVTGCYVIDGKLQITLKVGFRCPMHDELKKFPLPDLNDVLGKHCTAKVMMFGESGGRSVMRLPSVGMYHGLWFVTIPIDEDKGLPEKVKGAPANCRQLRMSEYWKLRETAAARGKN
jgi:hypothetical protein